MSKLNPGPRDYTQGTERALFTFSGMSCYFPECSIPVVVFIDEEPVCNVQIAHIHGAKPASARYEPSMTDDERRAFANLILLCTPHHTLVDRLRPGDHPAADLKEWKRQRETAAGIDNIALSSLTEDRLVELIEKAVGSAGPRRSVTAELGLGVIMGDKRISWPSERAKEYFFANPEFGPPVLILTVRNQGALKAYVDGHRIQLVPSGPPLTVVGEFPLANPTLPCALDVGESRSWLYRLDQLLAAVQASRAVQPGSADALAGEVTLGSGEIVETSALPARYLSADL